MTIGQPLKITPSDVGDLRSLFSPPANRHAQPDGTRRSVRSRLLTQLQMAWVSDCDSGHARSHRDGSKPFRDRQLLSASSMPPAWRRPDRWRCSPATDAERPSCCRATFSRLPAEHAGRRTRFPDAAQARTAGRYSPRYACRTRSSTSNSAPVPDSVMRPFSST